MMTRHAQARMQQRSIPPLAIDLLWDFGTCCPAGDGTEQYFFDKKAWKRISRYAGRDAPSHSGWRDVYMVCKGDLIVTTGYATKRRNRR